VSHRRLDIAVLTTQLAEALDSDEARDDEAEVAPQY
jgi:hypothetical protein